MITWLLLVSAFAQAAPKDVAFKDGANLQSPRWSDDGKKLSYEANYVERQVIELYQGDPRTGSFMRVVPLARAASATTAGFGGGAKPGAVSHELAWSPPALGNRFVYTASNESADYDLFLGGGGPLSAAPGADGGAAWSPDGRYIAFTSARTGQGDVYLLDVQAMDAAPRRISHDADASELFITWSPDSQKLVFVGHSDKGDNLWLVPALTEAPQRLTDWTRSQVRPTFAPDGQLLAFYANHDDAARFDLYIVSPRVGAVPTLVLKGVKPNQAGPVWTPDGKHLIAVQDDDERLDPIVAIPVAEPSRMRVLDVGTVGNGDLDVALVDGRLQLAVVAQGKKVDRERAFDRLFVADVPALP